MADHNGSHESLVPLRLVAQPARTLALAGRSAGGGIACSARIAHQGSGGRARRAQQPAHRLWPGGGAGRHRRPDHADALHHAGHVQLPAANGHHPAAGHGLAVAAQERGSRHRHRPVARVCATGADAGRERVFHGQLQVAQGRHPHHHAAARCRWRGLRTGPGQPGGGWRRGVGRRQQGADQPPRGWPHSAGRAGRAHRAHATARQRHHQPGPERLRLPDRPQGGPGHQRQAGQRPGHRH